MNALLFDTHQIVKQLMAAGFSDTQAETVTDVVRESRQFDVENLVTKTDLRSGLSELRAELKADIGEVRTELAGVRTELKGDIAELRAELKGDIAGGQRELALLRSEMQIQGVRLTAAIADSRTEILRWVVGLAIAQTGLIVALSRIMTSH